MTHVTPETGARVLIEASKTKSILAAAFLAVLVGGAVVLALQQARSPASFEEAKVSMRRGSILKSLDYETFRWLAVGFSGLSLCVIPLVVIGIGVRPFRGPILEMNPSGEGVYRDYARTVHFRLRRKAIAKVTPNGVWFDPPADLTDRRGQLTLIKCPNALMVTQPMQIAEGLDRLGFEAFLETR